MDILKQLLLIFFLCICGEVISALLPFAFPSSVISLLLLFLLLMPGIIKTHHIDKVSDFLLNTMAFFFIPAGAAIIEKYELIKGVLLPLFIITLFTTIFTFAVTGYTVSFFIKRMNKKEEKHNG
ncbi:CidA/LrgA family protein [[Clostridium] polysaccharolyticum]|jgi:holin-like protein|uniref:Holin-like protein n=1 Tax=[Clostridium] polysaccharolyticum TaxID=29364 RepID=A0A1I0FEZ9_9FIRM|nr:CidA/LrgA family protein [[Clostridium] polysaccharolyticum]SET56534.1 holin-like protein [[Clostridium] polysaccharolyticum]